MFHWICPVCSLPLREDEKTWRCEQGHSFDRAKSGYINLLLAQHKASKQPGDDKHMLLARRDFLNAGFYAPVASGVAATINQLFAHSPGKHTLLDCGCGEGYYLQTLAQELTGSWEFAGIDIAKSGIDMAAKRSINVTWVCASNARLPLKENSADVLLRIFAPEQDGEAYRVIAEDGYLVVVSPAEHHLVEIKNRLYDSIKPYAEPTTPAGFSLAARHFVNTRLHLENNEAIRQLLSMTPFNWRGKREDREILLLENTLDVQVHIAISSYQKQQMNSLLD